MRKRTWLALVPVAIGLLSIGVFSTQAAESKEIITFQCRLVQDGTPVSGSMDLCFEVWTAQTGGSVAFVETKSVLVNNGLVSAQLGSDPANPIVGVFSSNGDLWVAVKLGGTDLLQDRVKLSAVPYSMNAARASSLWDSTSGTSQTLTELDARYVVVTTNPETSHNTQISGPAVAGADLFLQAPGDGVTEGTIVVKQPISIDTHILLKQLGTAPVGSSGYNTLYAKTDGKLYFKNGTGSEQEVGSGGSTLSDPGLLEARLSVSASDPTGEGVATTYLYLLPFEGNLVSVWDSAASTWVARELGDSGVSITLSSLSTTARPYDVFVFDSSGNLSLETAAWSSNTARSVAVSQTDGVWHKTSDMSRKLVGTFWLASNKSVTDSGPTRHISNLRNRVKRVCVIQEGAGSWTHSSATFRQANGSTANQADLVFCLPGIPITARVHGLANYSGSVAIGNSGIGIDGTVNVASLFGSNVVSSQRVVLPASYAGVPGLGRHTVLWLESSAAGGGTTTWYGTSTGQSGMIVVGEF